MSRSIPTGLLMRSVTSCLSTMARGNFATSLRTTKPSAERTASAADLSGEPSTATGASIWLPRRSLVRPRFIATRRPGMPPGAWSSRQKRWLNGVLSLSLLGACVIAVWYVSRPRGPEPPPVDSTQTDPEIVEIISEGREKVIQNPSSSRAWGRLGLVLWVHDYFEQANFCLSHAERLDAQDPRWPYFQGIMLMLTDPGAGIECFRRAAERAGEADSSVRLSLVAALLGRGT